MDSITDKQKAWLSKNMPNLDTTNLNKAQASDLISEAINSKQKKLDPIVLGMCFKLVYNTRSKIESEEVMQLYNHYFKLLGE